MSKKTKYANLNCVPTWKLQAIANHPNHQGIDGADYGPVIHEIQEILWDRAEKKKRNTNQARPTTSSWRNAVSDLVRRGSLAMEPRF